MNTRGGAAARVADGNRELCDIARLNHVFVNGFGQTDFGWDHNNGFWYCLDVHAGACRNTAIWLERCPYRTIGDFFAGFNRNHQDQWFTRAGAALHSGFPLRLESIWQTKVDRGWDVTWEVRAGGDGVASDFADAQVQFARRDRQVLRHGVLERHDCRLARLGIHGDGLGDGSSQRCRCDSGGSDVLQGDRGWRSQDLRFAVDGKARTWQWGPNVTDQRHGIDLQVGFGTACHEPDMPRSRGDCDFGAALDLPLPLENRGADRLVTIGQDRLYGANGTA